MLIAPDKTKKMGRGHTAWHIQSSLRKRHTAQAHPHSSWLFSPGVGNMTRSPTLPCFLSLSFFLFCFYYAQVPSSLQAEPNWLSLQLHSITSAQPPPAPDTASDVALILFLLWVTFFFSHRGNKSMELIFSLWCRKDCTARKQYRQWEHSLG